MESLQISKSRSKTVKENDVLEFQKSVLPLVEGEPGTVRWYALQIVLLLLVYSIRSEPDARDAHLNGEIAKGFNGIMLLELFAKNLCLKWWST